MRHGKIHGAVTTPVSSSSNPLEGSVTTLHFTLNDTPGALADALGVFRDHGISMTHLESRPSKGSYVPRRCRCPPWVHLPQRATLHHLLALATLPSANLRMTSK